MKKLFLTAPLAVTLLGAMALGNKLCAQNRAAGGPKPTIVVLLDLDKLQIENPRLKMGMEQLNAQAQDLEVEFKKEEDAIKEMYTRLKQYKPGTPEYDDMDGRIVKRTAEFRAQLAMRQKELLKKQWKLRYSIFKEIQEEVEAFATRHQIDAVIRFNSDQPDIENPNAIKNDLMTRSVVWYEASLDITPHVREALKLRHESKTGSRQSFPPPQDRR